VNTIDINELIRTLEAEGHQSCSVLDSIQNEVVIKIPSVELIKIIRILLDRFDLYHLTTITAQVRDSDTDHIEVQYNFWKGTGLTLLTIVERESPELQSITDMIPGADFYEREVAEMFGISFAGRIETRPLLLPDDWDLGPPMLPDREKS
jgi:NADH-quinone oxidoreductase subunit C